MHSKPLVFATIPENPGRNSYVFGSKAVFEQRSGAELMAWQVGFIPWLQGLCTSLGRAWCWCQRGGKHSLASQGLSVFLCIWVCFRRIVMARPRCLWLKCRIETGRWNSLITNPLLVKNIPQWLWQHHFPPGKFSSPFGSPFSHPSVPGCGILWGCVVNDVIYWFPAGWVKKSKDFIGNKTFVCVCWSRIELLQGLWGCYTCLQLLAAY